jgi:hypothetical protein
LHLGSPKVQFCLGLIFPNTYVSIEPLESGRFKAFSSGLDPGLAPAKMPLTLPQPFPRWRHLNAETVFDVLWQIQPLPLTRQTCNKTGYEMRVEGTRGVVLEQAGHEIAGQTFIAGTTNADSGRGKCLKFFQGCLNGPFMRLKDCIAFWP